jgi:hypothetical protein
MPRILISRVLPPRHFAVVSVFGKLGPGEREQRAHHRSTDRRHAGQTGWSAAMEHPQQYRLYLVVGVVGGENPVGAFPHPGFFQPGIACSSGRRFGGVSSEGKVPRQAAEAG